MMSEPCGCHIVWRNDDPTVFKEIAYCSLHAAAPQMLEALKSIVEWWEDEHDKPHVEAGIGQLNERLQDRLDWTTRRMTRMANAARAAIRSSIFKTR